MSKQGVLFVDSGIGGLPYLSWLRAQKTDRQLIYLADTAGFPYGKKTPAAVISSIKAALKRCFEEFDPTVTVVACNTATVYALKELRKNFRTPFVGVVPAIKPASTLSANKNIGLLATNATISSHYTSQLIDEYAAHCRICCLPAPWLVDYVEKQWPLDNAEARLAAVRPVAAYFKKCRIDTLILACTHFVYLKDDLTAVLGDRIRVIDSVEGVGRQILRIIDRNPGQKTFSPENKTEDLFFMTDANSVGSAALFADLFGLKFGGGI